tara:strand:+ start:179 stop:502 length:324 start_codon:yes stop_codon:yes gene_type:complete
MLRIITNHQPRPFLTRWDVPESVLASDFDWLDPEEPGSFFCYRGRWYELSEFRGPLDLSNLHAFSDETATELADNEWDGAAADSYFSGVVIRLSDDGEEVTVGTYLS